MKYAYVIVSLVILALAVLMVRQYAPVLIDDIRMRNDTLYSAKNYRFTAGSCNRLVALSLCSFSVTHSGDQSIRKKFDYLILGNIGKGKGKILKTRAERLTTNIGRRYLKERLFGFLAALGVMILLLCIFIAGIYISFFRRKKNSEAPSEFTQKYLRKLAKQVSVPDNPVAVWKSILKEPSLSWVVFRDGTLVICEDKRRPLEHTAWATLDHFVQHSPGPHMGDYSIYLNKEHAVWIVSYPGSPVYNYIRLTDSLLEGVAGMMAREARARDAYGKQILYIERGYAV